MQKHYDACGSLARIICVQHRGQEMPAFFSSCLCFFLIGNAELTFGHAFYRGELLLFSLCCWKGWCMWYAATLMPPHHGWGAESSAKDPFTLWAYPSVGLQGLTETPHSPVWLTGNGVLYNLFLLCCLFGCFFYPCVSLSHTHKCTGTHAHCHSCLIPTNPTLLLQVATIKQKQ